MTWLIAVCIASAITASLILVPLVRFLARTFNIVDRPDAERKLQEKPIALGGGLAVFLAFVTAFCAAVIVDRQFFERSLGDIPANWYLLFFAAGAILIVGLIDDAWALRGRQKLLLQCLIVVGLVGSGTVIETVSLMGFDLQLGVFAYPISVLWLLMAVNALNLIDGADGMATTAGTFICLGLGFISLQSSASLLTTLVGFGMAGALMGFLVFNRPPASIYLGDAGSMMIGLFVGVLAVWSNVKESTVLASAPIAILAIPLFDSTAAIMRRWLTGRSIYATDRAHLHHLLQEKYGNKKMLLFVAGLCAITTTLSTLSVYLNLPWLAALGVAIVLGILVVTRSFGHAECRLLLGRASHFAQSFATSPTRCDTEKQQRRVPLQGVGKWDTIWEPMVDFAKSHDLAKVKIDLNLAWIHEGYHASWQSVRLPEKAVQLNICVPLFTKRSSDSSQIQIGRLEIVAHAESPGVYERIAQLSDQLTDLCPEIDRIVGKLESDRLAIQNRTTTDSETLPEETGVQRDPEPISMPGVVSR
ncbi:MAG: glycosyltransferase family 4 protein [Rubripirellula sp.]